jgi:hypothetical protein
MKKLGDALRHIVTVHKSDMPHETHRKHRRKK